MKNFINFLPPWVETNIQPAFYNKESGTVIQQTARMYAKVNQLVRCFNELSKDQQETVAKFVELKDFVEDYFDNLDVQEEVNNKLDEMAGDGTLETIVGNYIYRNVKYVFPKAVESQGDSNLLIYDDNDIKKTILIDTNATVAWNMVQSMLVQYQITHLDYLFITHYDADHVQNLQNLITYHFVDSDTIVLQGCQATTYGDGYSANIASVNAILDNNNITHRTPNELETITIADGFTVQFVNVSNEVVDAYTAKYTNDASMVCVFDHEGIRSLYTGDAGETVFGYLYSINFPDTTVGLYKIGHHGNDLYTDAQYISQLRPEYAVQSGGIRGFANNMYGRSEEMRVLKECGTTILPCYMAEDFIELESKNTTLVCNYGKPLQISTQYIRYDYYVDASVDKDEIQDGTEEHPFSEVMQAISVAPTSNATSVYIHVADGYYGDSISESSPYKNIIYINNGLDCHITITGNSADATAVTLNGVDIHNSHVKLEHLTVDVDNHDGVYCTNAFVTLNDVKIKSYTNTQSAKTGIILKDNSYLDIENDTYVTNVVNIITSTASNITVATGELTIGTYTGYVLNKDDNTVVNNFQSIVFENQADKDSYKSYFIKKASPIRIDPTHTQYETPLTLKKPASQFNWIEIVYRTNEYYGSTGKISADFSTQKVFTVFTRHLSGDYLYDKSCRFVIKTDGTVTISNQVLVTTNITNGTVTYDTSQTNLIGIVKILGGFNDYQEL